MNPKNKNLLIGGISLLLILIVGFVIYWFYFRTDVKVSVDPEVGLIRKGETQQFIANVTGATNTNVDWSVDNSSLGTISPTGVFTALDSNGSVIITAKSKETPSAMATATVTLRAAVPSPSPSPTPTPVPVPAPGPTGPNCVGKDIKRCEKMDPTISRGEYTPFDFICANGEYIETLSAASAAGLHGIGGQCTGSSDMKFFGGSHGHYDKTVGWKNNKPPPGGYQKIRAWRGNEWDSVGKIIIYDKDGVNEQSFATTMDQPEKIFDCGYDGVITGLHGSTNKETNMISTLGVYCGYKK